MHRISRPVVFLTASLLSTVFCVPAFAENAAQVDMEDLYSLPVEKLAGMNYLVTSAAKHEEKILDTAAAIHVINQEDIRRSGATSVPEALRGAPGVEVGRISASVWAISIRGFNDQYGNKLLVLVDGRSVYTPLFSGVFWDEQASVPLEDIERIEVIRGPGATLWGANAVNGVINIITKKAKDTQGNLATVGIGNHDRAFGTYRYGGRAENVHYRAYVSGFDHRESQTATSGDRLNYDWNMQRAGFRADWDKSASGEFTLQGDIFTGSEHNAVNGHTLAPSNFVQANKTEPKGGNILARWTQSLSDVSELQLQAYADSDIRISPWGVTSDFSSRINNYDVELQHSYSGFERQNIIWGGGARLTETHASQRRFIGLIPDSRTTHILNAFVQDEIALISNQWMLTLGSKFEHNSYTGFEVQPSVRTLWKLDEHQSLWAAVSRAVRTPSRFERDDYLTITVFPGPTEFRFIGNRALESEELIAYETGYRAEINKTASVDIAAFYNDYDNLVGLSPGFPDQFFTNNHHGGTYGVEIAPTWRPIENWMLKGSYSLFRSDLEMDAGSAASPSAADSNNKAPKNRFSLFSYLSLPHDVELDAAIHYVDSLSVISVPGYIPSYWRGDLRLGWKPIDQLELSLVGQNLFDHRHYEFQGTNPTAQVPIPRSVHAKATWRF